MSELRGMRPHLPHPLDPSLDEIPEVPNMTLLYFATGRAFNAPNGGVSHGTISVKFCTEVKRWLEYKMAKKYCRKFQPLSWANECYRRQTALR